MMWRFAVFVASIAVAIGAYVAYDMLYVSGRVYPPENMIVDTLYGPVLFLNIPVALGWAFLAAQRPWVKALGLFVAFLLLLVFLAVIAMERGTFVSMY
ncbi:MAG TPA: hypothetical protein VH814_07885 [Steroidobacteraceae bacterium]|jgi:hypothetical protein